MRINHNIAALNTYNQLSKNSELTNKALGKLSSGLRINTAGDDPAGLSISEKMRAQIRGLDQANANAQDGISLVQTAEGALNETSSILQRMRELAVQAGNDTATESDRATIKSEMDQLAQEVTRIADTTKFNGKDLMSSTKQFSGKLQIGADAGQTLNISMTAMDATSLKVATGASGTVVTDSTIQDSSDLEAANGAVITTNYTTDVKDLSINFEVTLSGSDEVTAVAAQAAVPAEAEIPASAAIPEVPEVASSIDLSGIHFEAETAGIAGDAYSIVITQSAVEAPDSANLDGNILTITLGADNTATPQPLQSDADTIAALANTAGGTTISATVITGMGATEVAGGVDTNLAGGVDHADAVAAGATQVYVPAVVGSAAVAEVLAAPAVLAKADVTIDGTTKSIEADSLGNFVLDSDDYSSVFDSGESITIKADTDIAVGTSTIEINTEEVDNIASLSVASNDDAATAITAIDKAIESVSQQRSNLGSYQNRLEHTINNLGTAAENMTAAESRVRDVDMASEMMEFTKMNILSQAAQSMLAQANSQPESVLQLLR